MDPAIASPATPLRTPRAAAVRSCPHHALFRPVPFVRPFRIRRAQSYHLLARVYRMLGLYEQAARMIEQNVLIFSHSFGPESLDVSMCLSQLGEIRQCTQQYVRANACRTRERLSHIRERPSHARTPVPRANARRTRALKRSPPPPTASVPAGAGVNM